jgi:hypothetical protein
MQRSQLYSQFAMSDHFGKPERDRAAVSRMTAANTIGISPTRRSASRYQW